MKLYAHIEERVEKAITLKLTLPKKWVEQGILQVLQLIVDSYNAKKPSTVLDVAAVHLEKSSGEVLRETDIVNQVLADRDDVYIKAGPSTGLPSAKNASEGNASSSSATVNDGTLVCRNYGCNQPFEEESNTESSCKYHTAPPVFHDTRKGWSCCPKRVYDWDEFHKIEGCTQGRHSTVDPKELFAQSPTVLAAAAGAEKKASSAPLKSIDDYNKQNPEAASAAKGVTTMLKTAPASTVQADGTASCLNKGCQKKFVIAENNASACRFHSAGPVFHDAAKFWSCCPDVVKYDFEAFLQVPGCMVGWHHDGTPESVQRLTEATKVVGE